MLKKESVGLIAYFLKAYPRRSALIVFLLLLSGFGEGVGVFSLFPLLEISSGDSAAGADSALMRPVRAALGLLGLEPTLGVLLVTIVVSMVLKAAFMWLAMRQVGYTVAHVSTDLRLMLIRAFLRARWGYFVSQRAGHMSNAIGNEAQRASTAYQAACLVLSVVIQVIIYAAVAFWISPSVAIAALLAGGLVILLMNGLIRMGREAGLRQTQMIRSLSARLVDALHSLKPIKAMAQEQHLQPLLEAETRELKEAQRRQVLATGTLHSLQEPILVLLLAMGLYIVLNVGAVPFSGLLVMAFLFHRLVSRIHMIQTHYQTLVVSESAFWSLHESVKLAEAERDDVTRDRLPPPLERGIELRGVSFGYGAGEILRDLSLDIPAGEFVAIVGPSGAGKTTLIDLVIGLYRPQAGEVYVDGVPLGDVDLLAWRRMIGYVPQEMLLFHDSVFHNVTLGEPSMDRARVEEALRAAGAWDFVSRLPAGLDTVIGEHGSKLSGGQRQRIAIARALVRRPHLLVLDEVTTALDPETEAAICKTLKSLSGSHTIISISHQPALKHVADSVYRLENGGLLREEAVAADGVVRVASA